MSREAFVFLSKGQAPGNPQRRASKVAQAEIDARVDVVKAPTRRRAGDGRARSAARRSG